MTADGGDREFIFNFWGFGLKILLIQQTGYELKQYNTFQEYSPIKRHQNSRPSGWQPFLRVLGDPRFKSRHGYTQPSLRFFVGPLRGDRTPVGVRLYLQTRPAPRPTQLFAQRISGHYRGKLGLGVVVSTNLFLESRAVFLNRRAAARYRSLASIISGRERFSWNLSF